jgi:hypothetical protein
MNEADALVSLRERYPSWEISLERGMWQAEGRLFIRSSSPRLLEAAMNGEPPFPSRLAKERVRVRANGVPTVPRPRPAPPRETLAPGFGGWRRGALGIVREVVWGKISRCQAPCRSQPSGWTLLITMVSPMTR